MVVKVQAAGGMQVVLENEAARVKIGSELSVSEQLGRQFNTRVKAEKKADILPCKSFDYYSEMTIVNQEKKLMVRYS